MAPCWGMPDAALLGRGSIRLPRLWLHPGAVTLLAVPQVLGAWVPSWAQEGERAARGRGRVSLHHPWPPCSPAPTVNKSWEKKRGLRRYQDPTAKGNIRRGGHLLAFQWRWMQQVPLWCRRWGDCVPRQPAMLPCRHWAGTGHLQNAQAVVYLGQTLQKTQVICLRSLGEIWHCGGGFPHLQTLPPQEVRLGPSWALAGARWSSLPSSSPFPRWLHRPSPEGWDAIRQP